jgi:putative sterol carrier protein
MPIKFPSDEWIKALGEALNASPGYAQAAASWEGDFIFICQPDADYPSTAYLYINLQRGKCVEAKMLGGPDEKKTLFTIAAPFGTWRRVIERRLDPLQGMFSGKLKVAGSMAQIQRTPKATTELVACASKIPTEFGV